MQQFIRYLKEYPPVMFLLCLAFVMFGALIGATLNTKEISECEHWARQFNDTPGFYVTTAEQAQCDYHGVRLHQPPKLETFNARVTAYSPRETCEGGKVDKCITAMGVKPVVGRTVACPRRLPLGTRVMFTQGNMTWYFTCEDHYAKWVQEKYGDTVDVFVDSAGGQDLWGNKKLEITIIK
jgi:3D (Asp-Asp-Asp) domain-containing protein